MRTWKGAKVEDKLSSAIEVLTHQLESQMKRVAETKGAINALLRSMGKEPIFEDAGVEEVSPLKVRRDEYYSKPFATAAKMYLERRKEASTPTEILKGLEQGGFDFGRLGWKENDRLRSLAISLAKNNKVFHKLPNGCFGLLSQYPEMATAESQSDSPPAKIRRGRPRKAKKIILPKETTAAKEGSE